MDDAELVADLIDRLKHSVLITPPSTAASSDLAGYCADLALRLWSLAVIDHQRGLGLLGLPGLPGVSLGSSPGSDHEKSRKAYGIKDHTGGDRNGENSLGSHLIELHRRVGEVIDAAGGAMDGDVVDGDVVDGNVVDGNVLDRALYGLAVAVGMPEIGSGCGDGTVVRVLSMSHIASVVQSGVMMVAKRGGFVGGEGDQGSALSHGKNKNKGAVDGLRRLRRVARRLRSAAVLPDSDSAPCGDMVTMEALCEEVLDAVERAKTKEVGHPLPSGFFDVMIPYAQDSLDATQQETLAQVASALQGETALRRKMMVDRAVATLKTFSIRQEAAKVRVLDSLTEEARMRMEAILEGRVAGVEEAWRMVKGEVVSLLVERGVGEEHGSVNNRIKTTQIGHVPDRGGRPEGVSRQAALMPEWKAREAAKKEASGKGKGGGGGGRGGGQHRGNKKQKKK